MEFEWDEDKNQSNLEKHGIDFNDAVRIFEEKVLVYPSPRNEEERFVVLGKWNQRLIAVVFTKRGNVIRIISARIARRKERKLYEQDRA